MGKINELEKKVSEIIADKIVEHLLNLLEGKLPGITIGDMLDPMIPSVIKSQKFNDKLRGNKRYYSVTDEQIIASFMREGKE